MSSGNPFNTIVVRERETVRTRQIGNAALAIAGLGFLVGITGIIADTIAARRK